MDVLASGDTLVGQVVSVRGPLTGGWNICTLRGGPEGTCPNSCYAAVGLVAPHRCEPEPEPDAGLYVCQYDDPLHTLGLPGLACKGDDSTLCCPFEPHGQVVVARGRFEREGPPPPRGEYYLADAALCGAGR